MKLILRDENLELMDRYLTNGGRSIPKLIVYDPNAEEVLGTWGPRPTEATKLIEDYRAEHGVIDEKVREQLQVWYNKDKGNGVIDRSEEHTSELQSRGHLVCRLLLEK